MELERRTKHARRRRIEEIREFGARLTTTKQATKEKSKNNKFLGLVSWMQLCFSWRSLPLVGLRMNVANKRRRFVLGGGGEASLRMFALGGFPSFVVGRCRSGDDFAGPL